jgi:hypothetical protein
MDTVWLALIASVLAPSVMLLLQSWSKRKEKKQQWERDDEVAKRLEESNAKIAALVANVATDQKDMNGVIQATHDLVNSEKTAAMRQRLGDLRSRKLLLLEIIDLKRARGNGHQPSPETMGEVALIEGDIDELEAELEERDAAQDRIDRKRT